MKIFIYCIMLSAIFPLVSSAAIINVPADQPNIQAGIDAAENGDTVLLADGTYTGEGNIGINFNGKAIIVTSESNYSKCVVDCENQAGSVGFYFNSGESFDSVIKNITVKGSFGTGGIHCAEDESPSIIGCKISGNWSSDKGGGIKIGSQGRIIDCIISNNTGQGHGGGIYGSPSVIKNCEILNNSVDGTWFGNYGGGLAGSPEYIVNCTFRGNRAIISSYGCYGGAISGSPGYVINCIFENNISGLQTGGIVGGDTIFYNCIFAGNTAVSNGAALKCSGDTKLLNCTFYNNTSEEDAVIYYQGQSLEITNSILWNDDMAEIAIGASSADPIINYSDIQGGYVGESNIDEDPLFIEGPSGDGYLSHTATGQSEDSPCINAGEKQAQNTCYDSDDETFCLNDFTTRSDQESDSGKADIGFHYSIIDVSTPTPIPTITPTPSGCTTTGVTIDMPKENFTDGDTFYCNAIVCNAEGEALDNYPLFVVLEAYGLLFFAPSFNEEFDYYLPQYPSFQTGATSIVVLEEFTWPEAGSGEATWIAALTNPEMNDIFGEYVMLPFSWSE